MDDSSAKKTGDAGKTPRARKRGRAHGHARDDSRQHKRGREERAKPAASASSGGAGAPALKGKHRKRNKKLGGKGRAGAAGEPAAQGAAQGSSGCQPGAADGAAPAAAGGGRVCFAFRKGRCKFGNKCRYVHDSAGRGSAGAGSAPVDDADAAALRARSELLPRLFAGRAPQGRFVTPEDSCYEDLLRTSYQGFRVRSPDELPQPLHDGMCSAMRALDDAGVYQHDVTQPGGLGTKCAKTFVTRTLVGIPGITYKYLGLRMFAIPWSGPGVDDAATGAASAGVARALRAIKEQNHVLSRKAKALLKELEAHRSASALPTGSTAFNLTLINRMHPKDTEGLVLKDEPTFSSDKCSVSWHADSSLKHYSTIAVYHTTWPERKSGGQPWRIALRVSVDAEGPRSSRLKASDGASAATGGASGSSDDGLSERHVGDAKLNSTPPIAIPLPDKAAYFLLDDFNHHHQHAVLAGTTHRLASTHRVSREEGHTVSWLEGLCRSVLVTGSQRRSLKQWRAEQALLDEIEFEWLRQWYIQGKTHAELHRWWHAPIARMYLWWSVVERRTAAALETLKLASEAQPISDDAWAAMTKLEKKLEKKRRKAAAAVGSDALGGDAAFAMMEAALSERQTKRAGWAEREEDAVFTRLPEDARPIAPPPLKFGVSTGDTDDDGGAAALASGTESIDGGSPLQADLSRSLRRLRAWRKRYASASA